MAVEEIKVSLTTKLMKGIISKLLSKMLYKQLGHKVNVRIDYISVLVGDEDVSLSVNAEIKMKKEDFAELANRIIDRD